MARKFHLALTGMQWAPPAGLKREIYTICASNSRHAPVAMCGHVWTMCRIVITGTIALSTARIDNITCV